MDYQVQQLILTAHRLRLELVKLEGALQQIIQQQIQTIRDAQEAYRQQEDRPVDLRAELQVPEHIESQRTKEAETQQGLQLATIIVNFLLFLATTAAFAAAIIYAHIAAKQLHEMRKATHQATIAANAARDSSDTSLKALHLEQRAWISIIEGANKVDISSGHPAREQLTITNTGRTYAYDVRAKYRVVIVPAAVDLSFNCPHGNTTSAGILVPNSSHQLDATSVDCKTGKQVIVDTDVKREDLISQRYNMWVLASVTYSDIFNDHHWMRICWPVISQSRGMDLTLPSVKRSVDSCIEYNNADKPQK